MRRASYRTGVAWVAENDEPNELDAEIIAGFISTSLLADLFGKSVEAVARGRRM